MGLGTILKYALYAIIVGLIFMFIKEMTGLDLSATNILFGS